MNKEFFNKNQNLDQLNEKEFMELFTKTLTILRDIEEKDIKYYKFVVFMKNPDGTMTVGNSDEDITNIIFKASNLFDLILKGMERIPQLITYDALYECHYDDKDYINMSYVIQSVIDEFHNYNSIWYEQIELIE